MEHSDEHARWDARYGASPEGEPQAARVLAANLHLLPAQGCALDLACGRGGNALLLAQHGLAVRAWDASAAAIEDLRRTAARRGLVLDCEVRDVMAHPPAMEDFDVITVSRFLERRLAPALMAALRPGGLLFYQTFTLSRVDDSGPRNPDYRLAANELLRLFAPLRLIYYREEGRVGDLGRGFRNEAMLIAGKLV